MPRGAACGALVMMMMRPLPGVFPQATGRLNSLFFLLLLLTAAVANDVYLSRLSERKKNERGERGKREERADVQGVSVDLLSSPIHRLNHPFFLIFLHSHIKYQYIVRVCHKNKKRNERKREERDERKGVGPLSFFLSPQAVLTLVFFFSYFFTVIIGHIPPSAITRAKKKQGLRSRCVCFGSLAQRNSHPFSFFLFR
jgi:hypothetical protein